MNLDVNKKIEGIMQSNALDDLSLKYLPPVSDSPDNYYFISYSHKDYKSVYPDIYALQAEGVNVWYDRAMPAGESWKETAEKYIRPSRCAGVVFYVSENSLLSPAIHEEIAFAKKCGKSCLTINLPMFDGKSRSAKEMLDALIANGADVSEEKYDFITQNFNDDVLYLPYSSSAEHKAEKIRRLKRAPVLNIFCGTLRSTNDIDIDCIKLSDLERSEQSAGLPVVDIDENNGAAHLERIYDCALANCRNLKSVELPSTVWAIDAYAFYECRKLESIDLSHIEELGSFAFANCISLKDVKFKSNSPLECIPSHLFDGCGALTKLTIPDKVTEIQEMAFAFCGMESITIPNGVLRIDDSAFRHCSQLREIVFGDGIVNLDLSCINQCLNLRRIVIGKNTKSVSNWRLLGLAGIDVEIVIHTENETYRVENGKRVINKATNKIEYDRALEQQKLQELEAKINALLKKKK